MSEEKDKQGGFKVAQVDMGEIRGLLCELGSLGD
jgi:hypothetical protein